MGLGGAADVEIAAAAAVATATAAAAGPHSGVVWGGSSFGRFLARMCAYLLLRQSFWAHLMRPQAGVRGFSVVSCRPRRFCVPLAVRS